MHAFLWVVFALFAIEVAGSVVVLRWSDRALADWLGRERSLPAVRFGYRLTLVLNAVLMVWAAYLLRG